MAIEITIAETIIDTGITLNSTTVELTYPGTQGAPGDAANVIATTPITRSLTNGTVTIGIDQTALSLAKAQIVGTAVTLADTGTITAAMLSGGIITNGYVASDAAIDRTKIAGTAITTIAGKALTAGTADYATTSGTSVYATNAGTSVYATNAGTATSAGTASTAGTSSYATTSGTAVYATTSGTSVYATTSGTAVYATNAGTAVNISGTIAATQVTNTAAVLTTNTFTSTQTISPATSVTSLIINAASSAIGLIIKLGSSGTSDLTQWQNNAGTVLAGVDSNGEIFTGLSAPLQTSAVNAQVSISPSTTSTPAIIIKGIASQTARLFDLQNSSGTSLVNVSAGGTFNFASGSGALALESSGAKVTLGRLTAAATNPGANLGIIYFRAGTNANTLKLVVRCGAAGAETTVLDNIPT